MDNNGPQYSVEITSEWLFSTGFYVFEKSPDTVHIVNSDSWETHIMGRQEVVEALRSLADMIEK